jgi:hypothetical protein
MHQLGLGFSSEPSDERYYRKRRDSSVCHREHPKTWACHMPEKMIDIRIGIRVKGVVRRNFEAEI